MSDKCVTANIERLRLAGEWLLASHRAAGGRGFCHSYSLARGWGRPYPETSGYIVPTLLGLGKYLRDERYIKAAYDTGGWLMDIQNDDGSFLDLAGSKQIFDTAQIIEGFIALYEDKGDQAFLDRARKGAGFIIKSQDPDGRWVNFSYQGIPHTYYARVSAILLELYALTKDGSFKSAAQSNISWVLAQQAPNGYFKYMSFSEKELPYLHNIVYLLEGLWRSYGILKKEALSLAFFKTVNAMAKISGERDIILRSQYDERWNARNKEKCLTGLAQWAGLLLMVKDSRYVNEAVRTLDYLKSEQVLSGPSFLKGALPGSSPIWGRYSRFAFNNWTAKFFIDSLMLLEEGLTEKRPA